MKRVLIPIVCASVVAATFPISAANAAPLPKPGINGESSLTLVGHRRHYRGRHHHGSGAAGIIGAIIAGTLIAAAIREGRADRRDLRRCDEDFDDFDPETGTYIDRYGDERVCPYLR